MTTRRTTIRHEAKTLTATQLAALEGRTLFPKAIIAPRANPDGLFALRMSSNKKLGKRVSKGWAKGMPMVTLTLQERATCPASCHHWSDCFGNNMRFAQRLGHGPALEAAIRADVATLAARFPDGFMVRLHVLGDFYSADYVDMWRALMAQHSALHVYGYTARHDAGCDIAAALDTMGPAFGRRWMIRKSGVGGTMGAVNAAADNAAGAVICPEQTGKAPTCAACGLCWTMSKPVAFITH